MGIRREFSCRYTPEQNGVAERKNRTIVEAARAMLEEKSLPKLYWIGDKVSTHELYFGMKPKLRHLRVFGSIAYVHIPKEKQRKLDAKAKKCILVGYSDEQKGYKCWKWGGRLCGRDHSIFCCGGRTCVCEIESNIIRTHRERERERHKEVYLY